MVIYKEQLVLRDLHYAIVDEVDSVLIDEARTPLIISGQSGKSTKLYEACDILAKQLQRGENVEDMSKMDVLMGVEQEETGDFVVNEKDKVVNLTEAGVEKVEKFFHIEKVYLLDSLIVLIEYLFAVFIANPILNMVWVKNQVYKAYLLRLYRPLEQTCRNPQKVANKLF
jgi:preprotein translocase subunit SecA